MKPLTSEEMSNLYCGLLATAEALRKLGETEGRSQWCTAMARTIEAKFRAVDED